MPTTPHPVPVQVNGTGNANALVRMTNINTGDYTEDYTNSSGQVVLDMANFAGGWSPKQLIRIEIIRYDEDMEYYVTPNGDKTYPTFVQVDNNVKYNIKPNTARFKLNLTKYPESITTPINITMNA